MFGSIGPQELLIVLIIALVVLGPSKLPEMARSFGRGVQEFRTGIGEADGGGEPAHDDLSEQSSAEAPVRVHALPPAAPLRVVLPPAEPEPRAVADSAAPGAAKRPSGEA